MVQKLEKIITNNRKILDSELCGVRFLSVKTSLEQHEKSFAPVLRMMSYVANRERVSRKLDKFSFW